MTPLAVSDLFNTSEIVAFLAFIFGVIVMFASVQLSSSHKKGKMQDLAQSGVFLAVGVVFFALGGAFMLAPETLIGFGTKVVELFLNLNA